MVESIKHIANRVEFQRVKDREAETRAAPSANTGTPGIAQDSVEMSNAGSPQHVAQLAEAPPIDSETVSRIKAAIASGKYPIDLDLISDALMDAYRELKS